MINERGEFVRDTSDGEVTNSEIANETKASFTQDEFDQYMDQQLNKRAVLERIRQLVG